MGYQVTVYSAGPACAACRLTKKALDREGVAFTEIDLTVAGEAVAETVRMLGHTQAPVVVAEVGSWSTDWSGFRPDQITDLVRRVRAMEARAA